MTDDERTFPVTVTYDKTDNEFFEELKQLLGFTPLTVHNIAETDWGSTFLSMLSQSSIFSRQAANGQPMVNQLLADSQTTYCFRVRSASWGGGGHWPVSDLPPAPGGGEGGWITASPNLAGRNPSTRGEPVENCFQWPKFFPKCWDPHLPQMPTFGHFGIIFWNRITPPQTAEFPLGAQRWRNLFQFGNPPQLPPPQGRVV